MRILHLGKYYPPSRGGMETVLYEICSGLVARGHEVSVLVAAGDALTHRGELSAGAGRLTRLACLGRVQSQPLIPGLAGALRKELTRFQPDIVHLHLPNPGACVAWLSQELLQEGSTRHSRLAIWHHADITRQKWAGRLVGPMVKACYDRADGICVSSDALRLHSRLLNGRGNGVAVIPFGIDLEPWRNLKVAGDGDFLFVGRLVPYKGVDVLLEALTLVPAAALTIVGTGPSGDELRERARALELNDRVRFRGELDEPGLRQVMASSCALVLPSAQAGETFGLVQIEAMAAGLPVISTSLPTGVADVGLDGVTGRCVAPGDVDELAAALGEIQESRDRAGRWGEAGRRRALELFSRGRMLDSLEDWYEGLRENDR